MRNKENMNYDVIALACEQLNYRDKLKLAQLLIQLARKEEEAKSPQSQFEQAKMATLIKPKSQDSSVIESVNYVKERILKLKPTTKKALLNSIKSMFNFRGGLSDEEQEKIIEKLKKQKIIKVENNKVLYL